MEVDGDDSVEKQVQVRFFTKLKQPELRVGDIIYSLPTHINRYGLSQVINALLKLESPQPFDFLVDGELIRTSLERLFILKNLSTEKVLQVEYLPALLPPQPEKSHGDNDWVSAVCGRDPRFIISGCYDTFVRFWTEVGVSCLALEGHSDAVTSITLRDAGFHEETIELVTSSKDQTLRLWQVPTSQVLSQGSVWKTSKVYKGHTSSVQCADISPSGDEICSGSWDATIKIWKVSSEEDHDEESEVKKRKGNTDKVHIEHQAAPWKTLDGHTQCVAAVAWSEADSIFSASWDHSIRSWDVESGVNSATLTCSKALHCLSVRSHSSCLLAAGGADSVIRIWDPRIPGTVAPILQLFSHKGWISSLRWHALSANHLLSSSYDGSLKLWDIRSTVPLHTLEGHKDKVLCADWWKDDCIVSGGDDCQLKTYTGATVGAS